MGYTRTWLSLTWMVTTRTREKVCGGAACYTYWKRTVLSPNMQVFDASTREFCTVRETRTNTPLQSLNLMNDVTYVEAARMFAQRMLSEGGATPEERINWAFRMATSRPPFERERRVLLKNLATQLDYFTRHPPEAARLLTVGERRNDNKLNHGRTGGLHNDLPACSSISMKCSRNSEVRSVTPAVAGGEKKKDEGGGMKDELKTDVFIHPSAFILHPFKCPPATAGGTD
ncbi:MAG: DUF1553 domain-containing protein [Pyrinomonadaceae bacterium]